MTSNVRSNGFKAGNSSNVPKTVISGCVRQLLGSKTDSVQQLFDPSSS